MQPINNITVKVNSAKNISVGLFDQDNEVIYIHEVDIQVADSNIISYRLVTGQTSIEIMGKSVGNTTITFSAKGVNKVLNVAVVAAVPTTLNVYEGDLTIINKEVYN